MASNDAAASAPDEKPAPSKGSLFVVFLTVLIDLIGFGLFIPLLPFYGEKFGGDTVLAGALVGTYSIVQLFCLPLLGRLSDRHGRRPILLLGLGGSCAAYALFAVGTSVESLTLMFAARALAGMFGATISTAQAYVADVTTPETRAKGMGMIGAAFGLGFTFGPPIGGFLSEWLGEASPGWFAAGLSGFAFLVGWFKLPESHHPDPSPESKDDADSRTFSFSSATDVIKDGRRGPLLVLFLFQTWAFANLEAMFSLLGKARLEFDKSDMGLVFLFVGLVVAMVQGGMIHRLTKKMGERKIFSGASLGLAIGFMGVGFASTTTLFLLFGAVIALCYGMSSPTLNSLISRNTPAARQGATFGTAAVGAALGRAIGHSSSGALFKMDPSVPFVAAGLGMLFVVALFARYRRRYATDLVDESTS